MGFPKGWNMYKDKNGHYQYTGMDCIKNTCRAWKQKPYCAAKIVMNLGRCTSCCCNQGLTRSSVAVGLVHGGDVKCGTWFTIMDVVARVYMSLWRNFMMADHYGPRCWTPWGYKSSGTGKRL